jgi:hypothetical protein
MSMRRARWPRSSIHTPRSLARSNRRLDHRLRSAEHVLQAMAAGQSLHLSFSRRDSGWRLHPSGERVATDAAKVIIRNPQVVAVNDGLFPETPQTWRWVGD